MHRSRQTVHNPDLTHQRLLARDLRSARIPRLASQSPMLLLSIVTATNSMNATSVGIATTKKKLKGWSRPLPLEL